MEGVADLQDVSAFPNCESYGQKTFEELTRYAPKLGVSRFRNPFCWFFKLIIRPQKRWAAARLRFELLWQLILGNTAIPRGGYDKLNRIEQITEKTELTFAESQAEDLAYAIALAFLRNTSLTSNEDKKAQGELDDAITAMEGWHLVASQSFASENDSPIQNAMALTGTLTIPDWLFFHDCYIALEMCDLTLAACGCMKRCNRVTKFLDIGSRHLQLDNIADLARGTMEKLQKAALEQRNRLQAKGTVEELVEVVFKQSEENEDDIGRELKGIVGEKWMKTIAEDLRESWIDNLEGVLRTRPCWEKALH